MSVIWRKVWLDLWQNKGRTLDEALAKGYLEGRYGAIPFIREDLFEGLISNGEK